MRANLRRFVWAGWVQSLLLLCLAAGPGSPETRVASGQIVTHPPQPADATGRTEPEDEAQRQMMKKLELRRNEERQKQLVKDTDKLLSLATDLKSEVDKTNKDVLSVEVVKKAEEIEKLAKSVKDRMRFQ
jgi:HAMP domain-containing protein